MKIADNSATFFPWYNTEHRHSGIAMLTPAMMHFGSAETMLDNRHAVMLKAFATKPEHFIAGEPHRKAPPPAAWINQPADDSAAA